MKVDLKDFILLSFVCTIALFVLFFANYPLNDWLPFSTLIFPKLGEYSLVSLINRFAWFIIGGGMLAFAVFIAWRIDWW